MENVDVADVQDFDTIDADQIDTEDPASSIGYLLAGLGTLALGGLTVVAIKKKDEIKVKIKEGKEKRKARKVEKLKKKLETLDAENTDLNVDECEAVDVSALDEEEQESKDNESEE